MQDARADCWAFVGECMGLEKGSLGFGLRVYGIPLCRTLDSNLRRPLFPPPGPVPDRESRSLGR